MRSPSGGWQQPPPALPFPFFDSLSSAVELRDGARAGGAAPVPSGIGTVTSVPASDDHDGFGLPVPDTRSSIPDSLEEMPGAGSDPEALAAGSVGASASPGFHFDPDMHGAAHLGFELGVHTLPAFLDMSRIFPGSDGSCLAGGGGGGGGGEDEDGIDGDDASGYGQVFSLGQLLKLVKPLKHSD